MLHLTADVSDVQHGTFSAATFLFTKVLVTLVFCLSPTFNISQGQFVYKDNVIYHIHCVWLCLVVIHYNKG